MHAPDFHAKPPQSKFGRKIAVIGAPGAGKSWLSVELGRMMNIPVYHLDVLHWKEGWIPSAEDEFLRKQQKITAMEEWIIDGNYGSSIDLRLEAAETIVFLDLNRCLCIWRVFRRLVRSGKEERRDMAQGCVERLDGEFLRFVRFIWDYPKKSRPRIMERIRELGGEKNVVCLTSRAQVKKLLASEPAI